VTHPTAQRLIDDLEAARAELHALVDRLDPGSMTTAGLVGEWSARELLAHVGYWAGHAVDVIRAVEDGRADEVGAGEPPVDEVNATVARVARETDLATVRKREGASADALVDELRRLDAGLLPARLPDGATLERGIREDGPDHYHEHAEALRHALERGARD
jgi:hypothetical protein